MAIMDVLRFDFHESCLSPLRGFRDQLQTFQGLPPLAIDGRLSEAEE